ncbi:hypothetical protein SEA_YELLOWPANDA_4 [Microbacterium phage YellowPanda]|uniref:Uncharacterized protein n=2 Tax=Tinytimothyvirus tinytimothy TaxID=2845596 RepID=A0A5Q2WGZ8_9CAUD|nr:hypothetical protein HWC33_gp04 [Microbacterium phage TinyTimothy]QDF16957.1 hypothetical protein SEA_TINYTIMOTHY_4 [Microbacterium phage TinyTimothy]QGH78645.1 hypothetical protein SEA_WESAK_4 [Microbacterium phage Wesak]
MDDYEVKRKLVDQIVKGDRATVELAKDKIELLQMSNLVDFTPEHDIVLREAFPAIEKQ